MLSLYPIMVDDYDLLFINCTTASRTSNSVNTLAARAFRKLLSIYVFSYFPFGFEGRIWDLIVSVPDHCSSFYFSCLNYGGPAQRRFIGQQFT